MRAKVRICSAFDSFFLASPAKDSPCVVGRCTAQRCGGFTVTQHEKAGEQGPKAAKMHGKLWEAQKKHSRLIREELTVKMRSWISNQPLQTL